MKFAFYSLPQFPSQTQSVNFSKNPNKAYKFLGANDIFFSLSLSLMKPNRRFCLDSLVTPICAVDCYNWHELKFLLSLIVAQRQFQFGFKWPYADKDNWTNQNSLLCLCQVNTNLVLEMPSIFFPMEFQVKGYFSPLRLQTECCTTSQKEVKYMPIRK